MGIFYLIQIDFEQFDSRHNTLNCISESKIKEMKFLEGV